jgi:integrase
MPPPHTSTTTSTTKHRRSQPRKSQRLKIIQQQLGHSYASTTSLYTSVSSDFKQKVDPADDYPSPPDGRNQWLNNAASAFTGTFDA